MPSLVSMHKGWNRTIAGHEAFGPRLNLSSTHTGDCTSVGLSEVVPSKQPTPLHQQECSPKSSAKERIKLHHSNCNRRALRKSLPKKHKPKRRKAQPNHRPKKGKKTNQQNAMWAQSFMILIMAIPPCFVFIF